MISILRKQSIFCKLERKIKLRNGNRELDQVYVLPDRICILEKEASGKVDIQYTMKEKIE